MRRNTIVASVVAGTVAAAGMGWAAGRTVRSPAQIAAQTASPTPSLITVAVERRTLSADVIVRGTVRYGSLEPVTLVPSALKSATGILTIPPVPGATVREGTSAMTVSGRPVFVLPGTVPTYRDLGPLTTGEDVRQLEAALLRLGYDPGPVDGVYDGHTAAAVAAFYTAAGFHPFGPTDQQLKSLHAAQSAMSQAQDAWLKVRADVDAAMSGASLTMIDAVVAQRAAAAAVAAAAAKLDQDRAAAALTSRAKALALADAKTAASSADRALATARAGIDPVTGLPGVTPADLTRLQDVADRAANAATVAAGDVAIAQQAAAATEQDDLRLVAGARDTLMVADAKKAQAGNPVGVTVLLQQQVRAADDLRRAEAELSQANSEAGVQVPADEVLFFPALPLRVDTVKLKSGDAVSGEVMRVSSARLAVDAALSLTDATLVHVGGTVTIDEPNLGITVHGKVTLVAPAPGTNGVDPQHMYLEVTPDAAPPQLVGASVKLTIAVKATQGEALAVPASALSVAADGSSRVQVDRAGRTTFVAVVPGLGAQGLVEVKPLGAPLAAGDRVVIGVQGATAAPKPVTGGGPTPLTTTSPRPTSTTSGPTSTGVPRGR